MAAGVARGTVPRGVRNREARPMRIDRLEFKPDWPRAAERWRAYWELANTDRPLRAVFERFRAMVAAPGTGWVWGWPGLCAPEPVMITQSDLSCMISGTMHRASRPARR